MSTSGEVCRIEDAQPPTLPVGPLKHAEPVLARPIRARRSGLGIAVIVFGITAGQVIFLPLLFLPFGYLTSSPAATPAADFSRRTPSKLVPLTGCFIAVRRVM